MESTTAGFSTVRRLAISPRASMIVLAGAAGLALRIWAYRSAVGAPDSDEAVVGLMTRHALHGELSTFYWGQPYGGTQEVILGVPLFAITGGGLLPLRVVPTLLYALAALLVWRVGRRTIGEPAAAVAAALFWIWPPYTIVRVTPEFGFYASNLFYCALLVLLALRIVERPDRVRVGVFGFVLGLAFWQTAQIIPIALPLIAWTIWRRPEALRHVWLALPLAGLGALPWLVWNLEHDWGSLMARSTPGEYAHGLRLFASPLLPMMLGLRTPLTGQLLLPKPLMYLLYVGLLALFVVAAVRSRRRTMFVLFAIAAAFPFSWAVSHRVTVLTSHPVFLVVLSPVLALLLGSVARTPARAAALLAVALVVTVVSLTRIDDSLRSADPHWPPTTPRDLDPLVATLDRLGIDHVYANYWIAYRLDFDTNERVVATENLFRDARLRNGQVVPSYDPYVRYRPYQRQVRAAPRAGIVLFRADVQSTPVVPVLERHGYRRHRVGPFVVLAPPA